MNVECKVMLSYFLTLSFYYCMEMRLYSYSYLKGNNLLPLSTRNVIYYCLILLPQMLCRSMSSCVQKSEEFERLYANHILISQTLRLLFLSCFMHTLYIYICASYSSYHFYSKRPYLCGLFKCYTQNLLQRRSLQLFVFRCIEKYLRTFFFV